MLLLRHDKTVKICDLTQFYSPRSGGVKRYVHEKIAYISDRSPDDTHVLIVPGPKTEVTTNGAVTSLFDSLSIGVEELAISRTAKSPRNRRNPGARTSRSDRIKRSVSDRMESNCCRSCAESAGGWFLSLPFSGGVFAREHEISWQTWHTTSNEIDARLCAQTCTITFKRRWCRPKR